MDPHRAGRDLPPAQDPAITVGEPLPLDAVVLSHLHGDHFDRVASREPDRGRPILTTPHAARRLSRRGFREPVALRTWADVTMGKDGASLTVTSLPGRHAFGALAEVLPPVMGTLLEYRATPGSPAFRVYLSGDTLVHDDLQEIRDHYPAIDLAVVHLGGTRILGLLLTMDGEQGVDLLRPRRAVPVHFDDYSVMKSPLSDFTDEVRRLRPDTEVTYLDRGHALALPTAGA
ncbi:MBL fold metallo-hydrolase [Saccharothrix hoggarensis]|uniref:MBL fold metallo-hydrolase n=1 Tax=Saccharothrix hoggarensis TaxID=913853 RepID=A0ABW3QP04_9PSEU